MTHLECPSPGKDYNYLLEETINSIDVDTPSSISDLIAENHKLKTELTLLAKENAQLREK